MLTIFYRVPAFFALIAVCSWSVLLAQGEWRTLNGPRRTLSSFDVSASDHSTVYTADILHLMKTTDGGNEWFTTTTRIDSPLVVSANPAANEKVIVCTRDTAFISLDGGQSFPLAINTALPLRLSRSFNHPEIVWFGRKYKEGETSLMRTPDEGVNWEIISYFRDSVKTNVTDITVNSSEDNEVWVSGTGEGKADISGLWHSTNALDANPQWEYIRVTGSAREHNINSVVMLPDARVLAGTSRGDIYRRTNDGSNLWKRVLTKKETKSPILTVRRVSGSTLIATTEKGVYISSADGDSATWEKLNDGTNALPQKYTEYYSISVDPTDANIWYVSTSRGVYKTTDNGDRWIERGAYTVTVPSANVCANTENIFSMTSVKKKNSPYPAGTDRYDFSAQQWDKMWFDTLAKNFECKNIYFWTPDSIFATGRLAKDGTKRGQSDTAAIFFSGDRGSTWHLNYRSTQKKSHAAVNGIVWMRGALYAYGKMRDSVNLLVSTNRGSTWEETMQLKGAREILSISVRDTTNQSIIAYSVENHPGKDKVFQIQDVAGGGVIKVEFYKNFSIHNCATFHLIGSTDLGVYYASNYGLYRNGIKIPDEEIKGHIKQVLVFDNKVFIIKEGNPDAILWSPIPGDNNPYQWTVLTSDSLGIETINAISIISNDGIIYNLVCATNIGVLVYNSCPTCQSQPGVPIVHSPYTAPQNFVVHSGEEVHFIEDVTVPDGTSFIVEAGATVLFDEGIQMRVEGNLLVQGTSANRAHFISPYEGTKWKGIHAMPGSSISMEYAEIADATIGVLSTKADMELSNVLIQNCRIGAGIYSTGEEKPLLNKCSILNNNWGIVLLNQADALLDSNIISGGQKGILIDASSPLLFGNTIENNTQVGVVVYGGGYPRFGDVNANAQGYNVVQGNALTQILTVQGYAFLGYLRRDCITQLGGENIIAGTDPNAPLCVAIEKSAITSMATEWGLANVSAEDFIHDEQSHIIYHCLSQEPENDEEHLLWLALEHRSIGNYPLAKEEYISIIQNGTVEQAMQALGELSEMLKKKFEEDGNETELEEFYVYLNTVASSHPFEKVKQSASIMLALAVSQNEEILDAYDKFESLTGLTLDADAKISAQLSKNVFEASDLKYDDEALATTTALYSQFPNDERTQLAGIFTEIITGMVVPQNNAKRRNFSVAMRKFPGQTPSVSNLPKTFALYQNYPNPFNPETKFLFDVPMQANVEITLYDLLGRKVTTLVNEVKPAGRYTVQWNAANNASGVYFAKMFSEHFSQIRKIMLMK